jgi:replicative DNA helicase
MNNPNFENNKLPPHSIELEENVLGSIMIDREAIYKINLKPEDFYNVKNQTIFREMCLLRDKRAPIDLVSLGEKLGTKLKGIGGHTKLITLSNRVPTASNIKYHAKKVKEFSYKREIISKSQDLTYAAYNNGDIEKLKRNLIDTGVSDLKVETIKSLAGKFSDYYFKEEELGIMTGIPKIDEITNGSGAGEIVTFTADSGQGKSNMLMNIAIHNLKLGKKVMYVNIEMDTNDILTRMIAMYNDLDASGIRAKREDSQRVMAGLGEMENSNFKLITEGKIKSEDIIQQAYIEKMKDGLDILIVDYLNEIKDDRDEKLNLNIATGNLKDGALRLEVPVFTAYQMDKFARREDSTPKKEDARGSTVVADRASMMFSIVNESMRSKEYDPFTKDDDEMSIYVLKNRNGPKNFKFDNIYLNKKSLMFYELSC